MKLSEAIRLGAMIRPQAFGTSFDGVGTCAWGAADEAMGVKVCKEMAYDVTCGWNRKEWKWTKRMQTVCPVCNKTERVATLISTCLNDKHRWDRERIADWVATIEPQEIAHDLQPEPNQDLLNMPHSQNVISGGMGVESC